MSSPTNGWEAIQLAAEHQQQRILARTDITISHTLLSRSMDEGLSKAGYDQLIRAESFEAGRRQAIGECAEVCDRFAQNALDSHLAWKARGVDGPCGQEYYEDAARGVRSLLTTAKPAPSPGRGGEGSK